MMKNKFLRFWFPIVLYSAIIFLVSSIPGDRVPVSKLNMDKGIHLVEYTPFGFLLARAIFHTYGGVSKGLLVCLVVIGSFLYGVSDEFHQSFVLGRYADVFDVLADSLGGLIGGYLFMLLNNKRRIKSNDVH